MSFCAACEAGDTCHDLTLADDKATCEFVFQLVPSPATMKFVGTAILHALGYPLARDKSAPVIWGMVADQLYRRKTLFLHLDEAQDLARFQTDRERQSVANTLKSMMENRTWPVMRRSPRQVICIGALMAEGKGLAVIDREHRPRQIGVSVIGAVRRFVDLMK